MRAYDVTVTQPGTCRTYRVLVKDGRDPEGAARKEALRRFAKGPGARSPLGARCELTEVPTGL